MNYPMSFRPSFPKSFRMSFQEGFAESFGGRFGESGAAAGCRHRAAVAPWCDDVIMTARERSCQSRGPANQA
jgi:hypothetical protein